MKKKSKLTVLIVPLVGLLALGIGIYTLLSGVQDQKENTLELTAKVVDYDVQESLDDDNKTTYDYYPIFSFTYEGKEYKIKYSQSYSKDEYAVGSEVTLMANPNNVYDFYVEGDNRALTSSFVLIPVGVLLLVFSVVDFVRKGKKKKEQKQKEDVFAS